ncbi:hypothetical protein BX659_11782 [Orenia metallireducens]|jgi:flavin-dependent dehydrogenase|uniref:Uncharacterized protein n=1 Tax=Orenia metallireducens TaxID=1413210 RepID=A0A285HKX3_9FIRM|nr:hypothetical protein [Orenia metallireducens]PRX27217.1 hypothetical protein BX659_11782 [Orenia metallireducens]SNY35426.1 hypothetical protein SAMN06265827_11982 [Orenia metallireducens]
MKLLKPVNSENILIGIGVAALTYLLGPKIKRNAKSLAERGMERAMMAGDAASETIDNGKEKMVDIFEDMGDEYSSIYSENDELTMLYDELEADREQLNELTGLVYDLKEEIASLKNYQ